MGQQLNKMQKRRRRKDYLERLKAKAAIKAKPKKAVAKKAAAPAAPAPAAV